MKTEKLVQGSRGFAPGRGQGAGNPLRGLTITAAPLVLSPYISSV